MKTGRMSIAERKVILDSAGTMTAQAIADKLGRDVAPVLRYMEKEGLSENKKKNYEVQAEYEIKERPYWRDLQAQFSPDELELFLYYWKQIVAQFRKDILATEELQIIDTIKLEVLMTRCLRNQADMSQSILDMEARLRGIEDPEQRFQLEREIVSLKATRESLTREYKELLKHKTELFKNLKGTRDQRVKSLEGSKKTFSSLVSQLMSDVEFYEECGREMELMRLAAEAEKKRLADYHTFDDKMLDQPLLTPDTVYET